MNRFPTRREFLLRSGTGFGALALAQLLGRAGLLAGQGAGSRLHHTPRVRRVVQLFMNGGVSQADTFDYKPELERRHGQKFDPGARVESVTGSPGFIVMKSPFPFRRHGQSGRWMSSVFPEIASCVDDMAFLLSVTSKTNVHGPGSYFMNTGFLAPGFPCMGAWLSYGLGNLSDNLPTFVVMPDPRGLPYNNQGNFSAGFLPAVHQGTLIKTSGPSPIADLSPPPEAREITSESEADGLGLLKRLELLRGATSEGDSRLEARIASYELAARMQLSTPELFDLTGETEATRRLYGIDDAPTRDFGQRCLLARRMLERGVRFVQVWSGASGATGNWDNHGNVETELPPIARSVDRPVAALLKDLKSRGMFEDTLVIWSTEFGRQPFRQGTAGRDHNGGTSVAWLAGAGIRGGAAYGESDEWGWRAKLPIEVYDIHATILHLLGIDHTRLTFRHNGAERRLTDVHGHVIPEILV